MKGYYKFMITLLFAGVFGLFFVKGPNGKPILDFRDMRISINSIKTTIQGWSNSVSNSVSGSVSELTGGEVEIVEPTKVYRWQDADGNWQYSDTPPAGVASEAVEVKTNGNVVQSTPPRPVNAEESTEQGPQIGVPLPLTIAPGEVNQLIKDAKQVQELMNERSKTLESVAP